MSIPRAQTGDNAQGARNPLLSAALGYAARGWSIIPTRAKKASGKWKQFQTGPADETTLRRLFDARNVDGLAVLLGSASGGLVARDFDTMDGYDQWAAANQKAAATLPTVATSRGRHVYFRGPEGFHDFGDGEYRGDPGHYCLLPPSRHPDGITYRWLVPLPPGELPTIDPHNAGLFTCKTAETADTATQHNTAHTAHTSKTPLLHVSAVLQAIDSTLPTKSGERNRRIFDLARALKALPALASADLPALRPIVVEWHRRALPIIRTKEFSESWSDFIIAWDKVKYPAGQGAVGAAFKHAVAGSPPRKAAELYPGEPPVLLLASLCRELQRIAGDTPFFLDCRTAGHLVGIHYATAWRLLTTAFPADGILAPGAKGSNATRKANEYRYVAD